MLEMHLIWLLKIDLQKERCGIKTGKLQRLLAIYITTAHINGVGVGKGNQRSSQKIQKFDTPESVGVLVDFGGLFLSNRV